MGLEYCGANATVPDVGNNLKIFRNRAGYTQEDVADRMGVSLSYYRKMERGERPLSNVWIERAANVFKVSADKIIADLKTRKLDGMVSAGQQIGATNEDLAHEEVDIPFEGDDWHVVQVLGESMWPWAQNGTRLFYRVGNYDPYRLFGRECVVVTETGESYVKILSRGSRLGLFNLGSYNAPPIDDQVVVHAYPIIWRKDPER